MAIVDYASLKDHWLILFQMRGSVWFQVIPYCIVNVLLAWVVQWCNSNHFALSFSPSGHALMSLIVSFLVVQKVNLAFDRYMQARTFLGHALSMCREINQGSILFAEGKDAETWRGEMKDLILHLLSSTIHVIKDHEKSLRLTKGECHGLDKEDPMTYVMLLRSKIYSERSGVEFQLLEKMRMLDFVHSFVKHYSDLVKLASTPLPFPMVQMARTCLFLWVFSLPLVLVGVFNELFSVLIFIFFLTYGFIGLELVAMQLLTPFGDGINDLGVDAMAEALVVCMENDDKLLNNGDPDKYDPPPIPPPPKTNRPPLSPYIRDEDESGMCLEYFCHES